LPLRVPARDVVVVRVSEQGTAKTRVPLAHVEAFEEIDVSGKLPLAKRPGLLRAIEMVEASAADHIVVAYFDWLVRSLKVQLEVIERVERTGGEISSIDHGRLANGTAATRMSNNMMGARSSTTPR
jgi:DNA invertase Pin-like site-specific DNA recombinase